ncbi:hypothetical protein [Bosea vaviloviae]|uniref:Uncharacterized protein n=1 Tax=Bosea vaviloviae TaxID=1526658 RepID=A0A1D7U106_9HYPH|nr:hypothetical protein [Bosea vaviloviae]AOO81030.1 hypothetical protein BHK69_11665 [Bosea vaviloviae]
MAYILRSLAVIGVIALNSPVHDGKSMASSAVDAARGVAKSAGRIDSHGAVQSLTAAREAAQILAGLDPDTRQRVLSLALPGATPRPGTSEQDSKAGLR